MGSGSKARPLGLPLLVAGTLFMENFDATAIVTAMPHMATDFSVGSADVAVALTAYLVAAATAIPFGAWLSSRFGPRRVFCAAIVLFVLASLLCALSPTLTMLTLSRVLQGLGAAMMVPVGRLVVLRASDKSDLLRVIALLTWPSLVAPLVAPALGGFIATHFGWQWIFLINIPLGAIAFIAALRLVKDSSVETRSLHWQGLLLLSTALFACVVGLDMLAHPDYLVVALTAIGIGILCGIFAVRSLLSSPVPLLNIRIFAVRSFRFSNAQGFLFRMVVTAAPYLLPLMFLDGFGRTPVQAGLMVTGIFVGNIGIKPFTTPMLRRLGFKRVLMLALIGTLACCLGFALFTPETPLWLIFAVLIISGVFRSTGFTAFNALQFADVEPVALSSANTLSATLGQLAGAAGITIVAVALRLIGGFAEAPLIPYQGAFLLMALLSLIAVVGVLRLPGNTAAHIRG